MDCLLFEGYFHLLFFFKPPVGDFPQSRDSLLKSAVLYINMHIYASILTHPTQVIKKARTPPHAPLKLGPHCDDDRYRPTFIVNDDFDGNTKVCRLCQKVGWLTQKWWAMNIKKFFSLCQKFKSNEKLNNQWKHIGDKCWAMSFGRRIMSNKRWETYHRSGNQA